ncbi:MAG: zinc ribbon domain-containing protein [Sphaerochaeta sp.]|jgi:hypothetical protein|nr:zinc ribbon domain-containing protein [Sphaerochaeta sp.]
MFLMIGVTQRRKDFPYAQPIQCAVCGKFGRYQVFMTYSVLLLFFIPCFTWGRKYYVQTSCCGTLYQLDSAVGAAIAHGEEVPIRQQDLTIIGTGPKRCPSCGSEVPEDASYCPHCGTKL